MKPGCLSKGFNQSIVAVFCMGQRNEIIRLRVESQIIKHTRWQCWLIHCSAQEAG